MNKDLLEKQKKYLSERLHGKTVLISGATGLVGSRTVHYLLQLNETENAHINVIGLYREEEKKNLVFNDVIGCNNLTFYNYDAEKNLNIDENVDYVIHCAGISGGSKLHLTDPLKVFDIGIIGTKKLLDFAVKHECKGFLYVSTYEIYGDVSKKEMFDENQPCNLDTFALRNIYAEVKRLCESLCCAYSSQYLLKTYAVRLTSTFGTGVRYNDPRFFSEFARCIIEKRDITLKSSGRTVRSYLDADDAASAFLYILSDGENCNSYNLTNMQNDISICNIATKMIKISGSSIKINFDIADDGAKFGFRKEGCTLMDSRKLERLGWKPVYSLDDTLKKLLRTMNEAKNYQY